MRIFRDNRVCLICGKESSPLGKVFTSATWKIFDEGGNLRAHVHRLCVLRRKKGLVK